MRVRRTGLALRRPCAAADCGSLRRCRRPVKAGPRGARGSCGGRGSDPGLDHGKVRRSLALSRFGCSPLRNGDQEAFGSGAFSLLSRPGCALNAAESDQATSMKNMSTKKTVIRPSGSPPAVGPYNHAVRVGDLLFCAGQIPVDPATGNLVADDIRAQTEQVLRNIGAILEDQGLSFEHVVKSTVFLTDLNDFAAMNEVYGQFFRRDHPARSTVQVAALPKGARVEIEVIACYPGA